MSKPATLANCIARMYEGSGKLDNAPAGALSKKTASNSGLLATLGRMEIKLLQLEGKVEQMASGQAAVLRKLDAVCQGIASLQTDGTHVRKSQERERGELPIIRDEAPQTQELSWVSEVRAMCGETAVLMKGLQQEGTRQREKLEGLEGSVSVLGNVLGYVGQVFRSSKVVEFILNGVGPWKSSSAPQEQKRDPPDDQSVSSHVTLCQETQVEHQKFELVKDTKQTPHDEKPPDQKTSPPAPQTTSPPPTSPPISRPTSPPPATSRPTFPPPISLATPPSPPTSPPTSLPTPPPPPPKAATSESLPSPAESSSMPPAALPLTRDGSVKVSRKPKEVTLKSREPSKVQVFAPEPLSASDVQKGGSQSTVPVLERKPEGKFMSKQPLRSARPDKNGKNSSSRTPEAATMRQDLTELTEEVFKEREAPEPDRLPVTAAVIIEEPTTGMPETGQDKDAVFIGVAEDISTKQTTKMDSDQNDRRPAGSEEDPTAMENKERVSVDKQDVAPNVTVPENSRSSRPSLVGDGDPLKPVTPVLVSTARIVDPAPETPVVDDCRAAPAPFEHRIVSAKQVPMGSYYTVKPNEVLGGGRFGQVHKCAELSSGLTLAAKIIKVKGMKERDEVKNEIAVMNQLNHVNLIQLYDAFECRSNLTLIMEFVEGGELFDRIVDESYQLTEMDAIVFMRQICEGVQYLHQQYILHLDLKPENILCVTSTGNQIKIIDFGLARKYRPREKLKVNFGTPEFLAPEVVNYDFVSFPTDMWSVGVITYMLLSGLSPFLGDNDAETMNNILQANWDFDSDAFENVSDEAKDFISRLLIATRSGRLSASGCMKHSWLNNLPEKAKLHHVKLKSQVKLQRYLAAARQWKKHFNVVAAANRLQRFRSQSRSLNTA